MSVDLTPQEQFIEEVYDKWWGCDACNDLVDGRRNQVFGVGDPNADIFVLGTAPGQSEDKHAIPFVKEAAAGSVYHELLAGVHLSVDDVYTVNIVACRPYMRIKNHRTGNFYDEQREPTQEERTNCRPMWEEVLYRVDPLLIVSLGVTATEEITSRRGLSISKVRGDIMTCEIRGRVRRVRYPVMPMFQPAYLARSKDKTKGGIWWKTQRDWNRALYLVDHLRRLYRGIEPSDRGISKDDNFTGGGDI